MLIYTKNIPTSIIFLFLRGDKLISVVPTFQPAIRLTARLMKTEYFLQGTVQFCHNHKHYVNFE